MTTETVLVVIDTETTGLTPCEDFVQLGAVFHVEHSPTYASFCELALPSVNVSPGAEAVHGWSYAALEQAGARPSQGVAEEFAQDALKFVGGRPYVIAGHNLEFDLRVIGSHVSLAHFVAEASGIICTRQLAERVSPGLPNHQLATVLNGWGLNPGGAWKAHDAGMDAWACFRLVRHYASGTIPYQSIADWLKAPLALGVMPFGAHKGKPFEAIPESYLKWLRGNKDMRPDLRFSAQAELDRRAKAVPVVPSAPWGSEDEDDDIPF